MKRSKHNLSHYRMVTANMGELVPISCIPVLPGDTMQHVTSALIRLSPLNTPVMHPTAARIHHFYVPNRITMPEWEDFITGGDGITPSPTIPTVTTNATKKSLLTYLGLPPIAGVDVSALPLYAVNKIFNEFYRDQDLVPARAENDASVPVIAWEKDYFSTARPWSQKGPDVTLPIGLEDNIPVKGLAVRAGWTAGPAEPVLLDSSGSGVAYDNAGNTDNAIAQSLFWEQSPGSNPAHPNIHVDLAEGAVTPNVNDFRAAFSLQRYQEARARYGSRFTEYLRYLGIRPSDARLQRPEYLGGGSSRISFSEVLQTAPLETADPPRPDFGVGDMYGHGIAGVRSNRYRKFFEEHGYVISMMSIRPKALYLNGVPRDFLKTTKEDFFQKELANLGQQEVYQAELYAENERDVFGFQDRYHEYRSQPSQVSQDFRDTLNAYHMGRDLVPNVSLNEEFISCKPSDRIFQVGQDTADVCWIMVNHKVVARRIVPSRANPRIL